tara:strand:+ start:28122 stop:29297 length:1176 start_codon:yes stop_codon:yes gene_type:complete
MVESIVNKYLLKEYHLVQVQTSDSDSVYHLIKVIIKKGSVKIQNQEYNLSFDDLTAKLNKNTPLILSFAGRKVINKTVVKQSNYLDKILFNKDPEDFFIFELFENENVLISLVRKEVVDEVLGLFKKQELSVIDLSVGPFILENIKSFTPGLQEIKSPNFNYDFTSKAFSFFDPNDDRLIFINIGGETMDTRGLIAFSGFINYLNRENTYSNFDSFLITLAQDFSYKKATTTVSTYFIITLFLLLVASYLTNNIYAEKSREIQKELVINEQVKEQILKLENDVQYKQNVISGSNIGSYGSVTFFLSQIASELGPDIIFNELNVYPVQGQISQNDKINIFPNRITISGATSSNISFNQWILKLESLEWVEKAEMNSYAFVKNEYVFTISLTL